MIKILDGGMSRELVRLGAELRQPEWSAWALMHQPDIVTQVHEEFIEAGADIITTNSYALVPFHIGEDRFWREGRELITLAGKLARKAVTNRQKDMLVAGCLPPIFGSYEPQNFDASRVGDYLDIFVAALEPYVDIWLGETLSLIAEAQAVVRAVSITQKPLWISFTLDDSTQAPSNLRSGETIEAAAKWAGNCHHVQAMLFNCSCPEIMQQAVERSVAMLETIPSYIKVGVYANAFEPKDEKMAANEGLSSIREDLDGAHYCAFACDWVEAGASIIGGCCGVGANHIHKLAQQFKKTSEQF